jgi:hypothetical protein
VYTAGEHAGLNQWQSQRLRWRLGDFVTGCFSMDDNSPARQAEQANFNAHMNAMTPAESIAYMNFLSQNIQATSSTLPRTYDINVYNY